MVHTSNWKGQIAQFKAEMRAAELGFLLCRPATHCRYDLALDDGKRFWRVQIKYANKVPSNSVGSVAVGLAYETRQRRRIYTYSASEVDALVVYIPKIDRLCWFPCEVFTGKKELSIRLEPPLNGQKTKLVWANNYFW